MAYKPVSGAPAPAPTSSGYKPVSLGIKPEGAPDDSGSPSLFGFLGNIGQEAKDMAQGITSLAGAAMHDVANLVTEGMTAGYADTEGFKLDDIAMALPKALAQDYNERYGISRFAEGDVWGGMGAILTGLYERPLSAVGDALMVGSAVKWTAKSGMLGESAKARILGPGMEEAASLTGGGVLPQQLSQNPVARLAQRKLYETMSYGGAGDSAAARLGFGAGPQDYITARIAANAPDEAIRAMESVQRAAGAPGDVPMRILRPSASKFLEKKGVNTILSHMGMGLSDKTTQASFQLRNILGDMDEQSREMVTSVSMGTRGVLPDASPSAAHSAHFVPTGQPDLPDFATFVDEMTGEVGFMDTPGTSPALLDAAQAFPGPRKFERWDPRRPRELNAPDSLNQTGERNAVTLETDDMASAYDVAQRYADVTGGRVVAAQNNIANPGSYDSIEYGIRAGDGTLHRVSVATPDLRDAQEAWTHMALQANEKTATLDGLQAQLDEIARSGGDPATENAIAREMAQIEDELYALETWNAHTFDGTRRQMNMGDGEYDPALAAADRIRNVVYNHATRIEIKNGLTYRKILDRAFGPLRAQKWTQMMKVVEEQVALRLERAMVDGVPRDQWDSIVLSVTDEVFGQNNPWAEQMFRTKIKENIPFETDEVMPAGIGGAPGPLHGRLATGETTIDPRPYSTRRGAAHRDLDPIEDGRELADADFYAGDAATIAHRLTERLRESTHKAMVENGEMTGMTWTDLAREQELGGMPFPNYYPHIKSSSVTADVAILNQNRSQMKTVLESPDSRMKKWGGWLYERGVYERDPIKAYETMFQQVQRHAEFRDAMHQLIDKYGRKVSPEELSAWDLEKRGEVLMSRAGLDGMIDGRAKLQTMIHQGVMDGKMPEQAGIEALEAILEDVRLNGASGAAIDDVWALPKYVAQRMKTSYGANFPGSFNFYYDTAMGMWKSAALSLSPRWVVNNTLGNSVYMGMSRPGAIKLFLQQLMPGARQRFKAAMGDTLLDAVERDFMHGEDLLTSTQKLARRAERGEVGWGGRVAAAEEAAVKAGTPYGRVTSGVRGFSGFMRRVNKHVEGAARRGVVLDEVRRGNITSFAERFWGSKKVLEDASTRGIADMAEYDRLVKSANNVLGDYLTMSPVEQQVIRRFVMPFYAFYRHTAKFMARMPFEHPLKVSVLQQIAEVDRQMNPYMPEYMLGTANIAGLNVTFGGANPIQALTESYAPQTTNPLLGLAVQRMTGTNPFGREWTNEPPGGSIELFGGQRYVIHRDSNGNVTGVQPAGDWAPPLYESLLGIIPQAGMLADPFDRAVWKRVVGPATGLTFPNYDPETSQYYAVKNHLAALKQAMGTPPE